MNTRYLEILLSAIGGIIFLSLMLLYFGRQAPEPVDTQKLLDSLARQEDQAQKLNFPNSIYLENLHEGLWGFERIFRKNNRISEGKYAQLCQNRNEIYKQVQFWLNSPYTFMKKNPKENYITVRPSRIDYDKIQHHFALESLNSTQSGLKLQRHEVQIVWTQKENEYELVIREAYATFSAYHPQTPLNWLSKIRNELAEKPLIDRGHYDEKKLIAFRAENCNN